MNQTGALRFDYVFIAACAISILGLYLDGWAHLNGLVPVENFATPYHFVMYGGYAAALAMAFIGLNARRWDAIPRWWSAGHVVRLPNLRVRLRMPSASGVWTAARSIVNAILHGPLPRGYGWVLVGLALYVIAGGLDFSIHRFWRIEADVEALFSPSHLLLFVAAALYRTGPLRAAWLRADPASSRWLDRVVWLLPMIFSATFLLASFSFFTQYVNPFGAVPAAMAYQPLAGTDIVRGPELNIVRDTVAEQLLIVGAAGIVVHTSILMGFVLLLVSRWGTVLPFGTFTLMFSLNTGLMVWMRSLYHVGVIDPVALFAVGAGAGLVADVLLQLFQPKGIDTREFRRFAFAVPTAIFLLYFHAVISSPSGIAWSAFIWAGLIITAGGLGYVMSYLARQTAPAGAPVPQPLARPTP